MRYEKDNSSKAPNPHCPRDDKPASEEMWLHPTPQSEYTSATKVVSQLKYEKPEGEKETYMGRIC